MATAKNGILTRAPQAWTHLKAFKRAFWKGERPAVKAVIREKDRDSA